MIHSDQINELATALSKAQAEMSIAALNCKNPFFKSRYSDLRSIVEASRPALTKYGLAVSQLVTHDESGSSYLHTMLCHSSGQWLESKIKITPAKNDIQSISSYMTYVKRMCYSSIVGVVTGDEDDDGNAAVPEQQPKRVEDSEYITPEQLELLERELDGYPNIAQEILDKMKLSELKFMSKKNLLPVIQRIQQIKNTIESNRR